MGWRLPGEVQALTTGFLFKVRELWLLLKAGRTQ